MAVAPTGIVGDERQILLPRKDLPQQNQDNKEDPRCFEIHDVKASENARLLFNNRYVFKILRPYNDHRYSLEQLHDRHACLLEGWRWNRLFTRGIHLGLARLYDYDPKQDRISQIQLGRFIDPEREPLDENVEYALVMRKLPKLYRLDMLLRESNSTLQQYYANIMTQFLVHIHASLAFQLVKTNENKIWGNCEQLKEKLINNLVLVEVPDVPDKAVLKSPNYQLLLSTCKSLRDTILPVLADSTFRELQHHFVQRLKKQQIKRCHGDLKARNIWILPAPAHQDTEHLEIWSGVRVLDAIDFNPEFCNIDTLSDFAMLVADIDVRSGSPELANSMIDHYLRLTKQEDKGSKFVLNYYLIEKAFVGATVSILYDNNSKLGCKYLKVCNRYLLEWQKNLSCALRTSTVLRH